MRSTRAEAAAGSSPLHACTSAVYVATLGRAAAAPVNAASPLGGRAVGEGEPWVSNHRVINVCCSGVGWGGVGGVPVGVARASIR